MKQRNKKIVAITNDKLFGGHSFEGFVPMNRKNFWSRICQNHTLVNRRKADKDRKIKQPVLFLVAYSPKQKKLFYFRPEEKPGEKDMLERKYSCGVCGHIKKIELKCNELHDLVYDFFDTKFTTSGARYIKPIGYINYEKTDFGKTHFGIVFLVTFDGKLTPLCPTLRTSDMISPLELDGFIDSGFPVDEWTKAIFPEIRKFFGNLNEER